MAKLQLPRENKTTNKPFRKITHAKLKELGYRLTDNQITLGPRPFAFAVIEVKNEAQNDNREIGFSFLYSVKDKMGVILPNTFHHLKLNPKECYEHLR